MRFEHMAGWALTADERLEQVAEQRREALGDGECDQPDPASREKQHESDRSKRECSPEAAAEGVEDKCDVFEKGCLDVLHQLGPSTVERQRTGGDEDREQRHKCQQRACPGDCAAGAREELAVERVAADGGEARHSGPTCGDCEQATEHVGESVRQRKRW